MLIYDFSRRGGTSPASEYLYHCLKEDILSGRIPAGTKLPSKRELAADNQISVRTVMNAYDQLLTEGYITAEEKRGYFAAKLETAPERSCSFRLLRICAGPDRRPHLCFRRP